MDQLQHTWQPICRSEEVTGDRPVALQLGGASIAAYRDKEGAVRALEDRCPHRRAPLSLGRVTPEGRLQCGYHGWTFDGDSGICRAIPNLSAGERVPERYRANAYRVAEHDGFIYVSLNADEAAPPRSHALGPGKTHAGTQILSIARDEFIAALLDEPSLVLSIPFVRITDCDIGDPHIDGSALSIERNANWVTARRQDDPFEANLPLRLTTETDLRTALTRLDLRDSDNAHLLAAVIAATPVARGATAVRWRCAFQGGGASWQGRILSALAALGVAPLKIRASIDGAALTRQLPGPSQQWRDLAAHFEKAA